jgi:hypothetical protein
MFRIGTGIALDSVAVEWAAFVLCIREVRSSNLGPEMGSPG